MPKWYDRFSQFNIPVRGADFKSKLSEVSRNRRTQPKGKAAEGDSSGMNLPDPALKKRRVVITGVVES
jgi:hypothetical protein